MENKKQKSGFTLIELILVMLIISVIAAISLSTLLGTQAGQAFNNNFDSLLSFLNNARTDAITGKGQTDFTDFNGINGTTDLVTPANYGVNFNTTAGAAKVQLFADINPPKTGTISGARLRFDSGINNNTGDDLVLKSYTFPNNLSLAIFAADTAAPPIMVAATNPANSSVFYSPLYADIYAENIKIDQSNSAPLTSYPFILIQLKENASPFRCRQIKIHQLAGVPEVAACP